MRRDQHGELVFTACDSCQQAMRKRYDLQEEPEEELIMHAHDIGDGPDDHRCDHGYDLRRECDCRCLGYPE